MHVKDYNATIDSDDERRIDIGVYMNVAIEAHQIEVEKANGWKDYFEKAATAIQRFSGYLNVDGTVGLNTVQFLAGLLKQLKVFGGTIDYDPISLIEHKK